MKNVYVHTSCIYIRNTQRVPERKYCTVQIKIIFKSYPYDSVAAARDGC